MRRNVLRSSVLTLAILASASVSADSQFSLSGVVSGVELCEQAGCGSAILVAGFDGEIGDRPAVGLAAGGDFCYVDGTKYFVRMGMNITEGGHGEARFLQPSKA